MIHITLNIGDVSVSNHPNVTFTCYGLGSCIGLFMQDRLMGLYGAAHIFLPREAETSQSNEKFYTVDRSIDQLIQEFKKRGSTTANLCAKIVGGASLYPHSFNIGKRNAEDTIDYLTKKLVHIQARDIGGKMSRTAQFNCSTGVLLVRIPETKELKYY